VLIATDKTASSTKLLNMISW